MSKSKMNISSIVVVCLGNICRSPMGEAFFKNHYKKSKIKISSAGINALTGEPAHRFAIEVMKENGYDITDHIATQIKDDIVINNDLILVMTNNQKSVLQSMYPLHRGKILTIGHWLGIEVSDPYGKEINQFQSTFNLLKKSFELWTQKL